MYIDPIIWLYGQISCSTARITFSTSKTITHLHIKANIGQPIYEYSTTHSIIEKHKQMKRFFTYKDL